MNTKKCCMCKQELSVTLFKSNKLRSDGLQSQCKNCHKKYRRQHYLKNKQKYIEKAARINELFLQWWFEYKSKLKCSRCPENHPACLDFHHVNPKEKEFTIGSIVGDGNKSKLLKEIEKCIVLCSNCHRKEHWNNKRYYDNSNPPLFQSGNVGAAPT